jgi:hypothetical protein
LHNLIAFIVIQFMYILCKKFVPREGFNQLNKPSELSKFAQFTPVGLMVAITVQPGYTDFCYLSVSDNHWENKTTPQ